VEKAPHFLASAFVFLALRRMIAGEMASKSDKVIFVLDTDRRCVITRLCLIRLSDQIDIRVATLLAMRLVMMSHFATLSAPAVIFLF